MKVFESMDIEDIILGMANVVYENRRLRREINDLKLTIAKNNAFIDSAVYHNLDAYDRYEILAAIEKHNSQATTWTNCGFSATGEDAYIFDWESEVERLINIKNQNKSKKE